LIITTPPKGGASASLRGDKPIREAIVEQFDRVFPAKHKSILVGRDAAVLDQDEEMWGSVTAGDDDVCFVCGDTPPTRRIRSTN
jgi:hypothetical protein